MAKSCFDCHGKEALKQGLSPLCPQKKAPTIGNKRSQPPPRGKPCWAQARGADDGAVAHSDDADPR